MAHRIYIYNFDSETKEVYPYYLGEWNYEIPELFIPLFSGNPRSKGKLLYFDKEEGVLRLRRFYQLLADHYQLNYKKAYYEPVNKMFEFLEALPYDTFSMNATDVFNMNNVSHKDQAKEWVLEIKEKNTLYEKAIENQNLIWLEKEVFARHGYDSFLTILETDWIEYGLGYWNDELYKNLSETFEENNLWGLKDSKGNIVTPAVYDEIFAFNEEGIAVAEKNGKFGYLRNDGEIIIECIYEDAFDAFFIDGNNYGNIEIDGKQGVINIDSEEMMIPCEYEELEILRYTGFFNAKKDGNYYLINLSNKQIIAEYSETLFEFDYNDLFYSKKTGTSKRSYYTTNGIYFGEHPEDSLVHISNGYYKVNPNKFQKKTSVIKPDGSILDSEIDIMMILGDYSYTAFAYKKAKKWYIYDTEHEQFRLENHIIENFHRDWYSQFMKNVFLLSDQNGIGLYHASEDRWLIPSSKEYQKMEACKQEVFRISVSGGMFYYDQKTDFQSDIYDYICEGIDYHEQLLCLFKANEMFILDLERRLHQVPHSQMGAFYEKKYNLRGKDQQYFLDFYKCWKEKVGSGYEAYFDNTTLASQAEKYSKEGNIKEAIRLYSIGVDRGDANMMLELGFIYTDDENAPTYYDLKKGLSLYEKAALQDQTYAWNNLGYHYQKGIGYPQDIKKALKCFRKSADLGNGLAMQNLGLLYFYGDYILQDYDIALEYYKQAEKKFQFNEDKISEIYYQKRDYANLQRYLRKDSENTYSNIYYGILYDEGLGVKQNIKKAISHYEKALEHSTYNHALERLLYFYKEDPTFANPEKYEYWRNFGEENEM
ncbi:SEL1-like repeat protein [Chryseobacterium sp. M5A1_1a]